MSAIDLLDVLLAGDFNPTLRADLPAAVRSALHGDVRPILRLQERANFNDTDEEDDISAALFVTTVCEEGAFPWNRADAPQARADAAVRAARAIPRTQLGPFDARIALLSDVIPLCVSWPNASAAPVAPGPLPNVPTLVIDGDADLRTPVTDARAVALRIPGAQFLEVPFVGHSVIGADPTGCARAGVAAFFAGRPVAAVRRQGAAVPADADRADAAVPGARRRARAQGRERRRRDAPGRRRGLPRHRRRPPQAAARRHADRRPALRDGALDGDRDPPAPRPVRAGRARQRLRPAVATGDDDRDRVR